MKKWDWLQKFLYCMMGILGIYIIYKGGGILLRQDGVQKMLDTGKVQVALEDAAMRTHFPGYTAVVENRKSRPWMAVWMEPLVPVYSYMAEAGKQKSWQRAEKDKNIVTDNDVPKAPVTEAEQEVGSKEGLIENTEINETEILMKNLEQDISKTSDKFSDENSDEVLAGNSPGMLNETSNVVSEKMPEETLLSEEQLSEEYLSEETVPAYSNYISKNLLHQLKDFDYLLNHYYTVDGGTSADAELLNAEKLLTQNLSIERNPDVPQILIYHTHSQEAFADSEEGNPDHTIVGIGEVLAEELRKYGYQVIHDTGEYDLVDGVLDRSAAYDYARTAVEKILEEHPTIEVIIDLHRDGVEGKKFVTEIDGKPTSMVMFFNGISQNAQGEELYWLENPYRQQNLAFSLQMQLKAEEQYPGLTRNIYLKAERFNLHLRPRSLLIEAGTQLNTLEEERNAMVPVADLIQQVLRFPYGQAE